MKRCDSEFMRVIGMYYGQDLVREYQKLPLLHLTRQNISDINSTEDNIVPREEWVAGIPQARLPFNNFALLFEQPNDLQNAVWCHVEHIAEYAFRFTYMVGSEETLTNNPTPLVHSVVNIDLSDPEKTFNDILGVAIFDPDEYKGDFNHHIERIQDELSSSKSHQQWAYSCVHSVMNQLFNFFRYLETSSDFPIQVTSMGPKNKPHKLSKKAKAEPYRRQDLPTIVYLNSFPVASNARKESAGGTHASPKSHPRRGTRRTLSHERFKNHEFFGIKNAIAVSPAWVGSECEVVHGTEYRVLSKQDIMKKVNKG